MSIVKTNGIVIYSQGEHKRRFDETMVADDVDFAICDPALVTAQIKFDSAGVVDTALTIKASQTADRTLTLPDATGSLAVADTLQYSAPLAGATVSMTSKNLVIKPAGTLATLTVNLPASPLDSDIARICTTQTLTALTLGSGTNSVSGAVTTLSADGFAAYIYRLADTTWYRIG